MMLRRRPRAHSGHLLKEVLLWSGTHGNEHWGFDDEGYMRRCDASISDCRIEESERGYRP